MLSRVLRRIQQQHRPQRVAQRINGAAVSGVRRRHMSSHTGTAATAQALRTLDVRAVDVTTNRTSVRLAGVDRATRQPWTVDLHNFWLRHNCDCSAATVGAGGCRHAATGERVVEPVDLNTHVRAVKAALVTPNSAGSSSAEPYALNVEWSDGHKSSYGANWLRAWAVDGSLNRPAGAVTRAVDDAAQLIAQVEGRLNATKNKPNATAPKPGAAAAGAKSEEAEGGLDVASVSVPWTPFDKRAWLQLLKAKGCLVVRGAPATPEATLDIVKSRFSAQLIETHFGLIEDLRVNNRTNKNNDQLGYTNAAVRLHTDQPFIANPPTMQMLHCIQPAECGGGSSVICDATAVAVHMRDHYPTELFESLTRVPVHFHRVQKNFESLAVEPIVRLGSDGRSVEQVRCSYFTMDPLHGPHAPYDVIPTWYTAYNVFTALARSRQFSYYFALQSGDFLVYDNWRMLHARTSFTGTQRFLRGIYLDKAQVFQFLSQS